MSIGFKSIDGRFLYAAERWALIVELLASNPSCFAYSSLLIRSIGSSMSIVYGKLANFFHLPVRHLRSNSTISLARHVWSREMMMGEFLWKNDLKQFLVQFQIIFLIFVTFTGWRLYMEAFTGPNEHSN